MLAFRALRFSNEGVSLLTDQGLVRLAYRDLAEVAMPPIDAWDAYYRQLAEIDPKGDAGIVRLETAQGMVFTASTSRVTAFRGEAEAAASTCLVRAGLEPHADSRRLVRRPHAMAGPATVVPLSLFAPQQVTQRGPGQQLEVASRPQRGRRRASQRRRPLSLGFWRPCAQRIGSSVCPTPRGPSIAVWASMTPWAIRAVSWRKSTSTRRPARPSSKASRSGARGRLISTGEIALARGNSAARQLVLAVEDGGDTRAGRMPIRWTSAIMPTGWSRPSCSTPSSSVPPWKSIGGRQSNLECGNSLPL